MVASDGYHQEHPEIFEYELQKWGRAGEKFSRSGAIFFVVLKKVRNIYWKKE